ncbi:MAG: DUF5685 family protein [Clostridioides sp.]|jgi:hypothetical protein|nr:DUF5685 family protein [Clostridioides sp.]
MFGYIKVNQADLTFREYDNYKSYYCGLCKCLKRTHGEISRLSLNYDIIFLIVLLSGVYRPKSKITEERCIVSPFKKKNIQTNEITEYAADMNVLLTYYKLEDDMADDNDLKSKLSFIIFQRNFKSAYENYPKKAGYIKNQLENLQKLESEKCNDIDEVSNTFGNLMGEIFAYKDDEYQETLRSIGFNIGKYIYILDAYEDLEDDITKNRYNPFNPKTAKNLNKKIDLNEYPNESDSKDETVDSIEGINDIDSIEDIESINDVDSIEDIENTVDRLISITLGFLAQSIDRLDLKYNRGIIENIIYSGLYLRANEILKRVDDIGE